MDERLISYIERIAVSLEKLAGVEASYPDKEVLVPILPQSELAPTPERTREILVEWIDSPEKQQACWEWLQGHGASKIIDLTCEERVELLSHFKLEVA